MTPLNSVGIELTRLIGKKELSFGSIISSKQFSIYGDEYKEGIINRCTWFHNQGNIRLEKFRIMNPITEEDEWFEFTDCTSYKIIGHPATETDFKRWMNEKGINWTQRKDIIVDYNIGEIPYDSSLTLLEQSDNTLKQIIELISYNQ